MNDKVQPTPPLQETERDRWNYDRGYEAGYVARLDLGPLDMDDVREELLLLVKAVERMIAEAEQPKPSRGRIEFEDAVIELPDDSPHDPRD